MYAPQLVLKWRFMEDPRFDQIRAVLPEFIITYYIDKDLLTGFNGKTAIILKYRQLRADDVIVYARFIDKWTANFYYKNNQYVTLTLHISEPYNGVYYCIQRCHPISFVISSGKIIDITNRTFIEKSAEHLEITRYFDINFNFIANAEINELNHIDKVKNLQTIEDITIINGKYVTTKPIKNNDYHLMIKMPEWHYVLASLTEIINIYEINKYELQITDGKYEDEKVLIEGLETYTNLYCIGFVYFANRDEIFYPVNAISNQPTKTKPALR